MARQQTWLAFEELSPSHCTGIFHPDFAKVPCESQRDCRTAPEWLAGWAAYACLTSLADSAPNLLPIPSHKPPNFRNQYEVPDHFHKLLRTVPESRSAS